MRILFADQISEFGGAQLALRDLLDEIVRRDWQAEMMVPGNGPLHQECASRGIPSSLLPLAHYANGHKTLPDVGRYSFDSLRAGLAMRDAAKRFRADLIYVNGPRVLPAAMVAGRPANIPILFHAHSHLDRVYTRRIARCCIRRGQMKVLAISRFVAQPFATLNTAINDGIRLRVVYNGVHDHGFFPRPRQQPSCIGIVGRISHEKGHLDFVRAARMMAVGRPELRFAIFGAALFSDDSYERGVRAAAEGAPVEFRGWTDDVSAALREIDILAVPSGPAEGATRVIMEAFSAGTPVVAYPSGGIPELVSHGETGWLTRAAGPAPLVAALGELLDNPALMAHLSTQGRSEWVARFQLQQWQDAVCNYIEETVRSQAKACSGPEATSGDCCEPPAPTHARDAGRVAL